MNSPSPFQGGDFINKILPIGYEEQVRIDMGVTKSVLPDEDIQSKATLAETLIARIVPNYPEILDADGAEKVLLEAAVVAQVCSLLCFGMSQRVKIQQQDETLYAYRIQATDWKAKKAEFDVMVSDYISQAVGDDFITCTLLGVVKNDRPKI